MKASARASSIPRLRLSPPCSGRELRRRLALGALATLLATCSARVAGPPGYLHVIVQRLPQCEYGVGFEQPLRIDLMRRDQVVATSWHSGVYTGERSLDVSFHVPEALAGRYSIRFGRCPSLLDAPAAAAACDEVDWVARARVRLEPRGIDSPEVVEYYRLRARCLPIFGRAAGGADSRTEAPR